MQNTCNTKTIRERLFYAKKYRHVLDTGNASDILSLTPEQRNRVMKALALLAKFHGCYDEWKAIRQKYDIKWACEPATAVFNRIISNTDASYVEMIQWIKTMLQVLPPSYGNVILFTTLTGLRANESLASARLTRTDLDHYLNNGVLEHFRYPDLFIRRTKKAFISIVTDSLIELAKSCQDVNYEGFRAYLKRRGYSTDLKYCRRVFATYLRTKGIEQETIDLLQGRVPKSVFARHYYRPTMDYDRIRETIRQLANEMGRMV